MDKYIKYRNLRCNDNIKPSYAKYGPLHRWRPNPDLETYWDYHEEQRNKLIDEEFDYVQKIIDENGGSKPLNDPYCHKLNRQIKRLTLKLDPARCEYYFIAPVPLKVRAKTWSLSPNNLLDRLMTLAKLKKIQKKEVCEYVRAYYKKRTSAADWGLEQKHRYRAVLNTLKKNNSENCGRFILRDRRPFFYSCWYNNNKYHDMEWKYRLVCIEDPYDYRLDKLRFMLQRRLNQQEEGREFAYDTGTYQWACHLQKHFFIGPVRAYYIKDSNPKQRWTATHTDNFFYTVNAHGEFVQVKCYE